LFALKVGNFCSDHLPLCLPAAGTTVGYGDVTVSTDEGRLFLAIYAILVSSFSSEDWTFFSREFVYMLEVFVALVSNFPSPFRSAACLEPFWTFPKPF
jgi:Ion channel